MSDTILKVHNLQTAFFTPEGVVRAVDGVSFEVRAGKTLGIVGESGCGKSVTSLSVMQLIPQPPGKIVGGEILFQGKDLLSLSPEEMRSVRGNDISMIFQEPMTSLNPVFTIENQLSEAIALHGKGLSREEIRARALEMLELVGIPEPAQRLTDYPHQLSGGMRQRVMIAMALSCRPAVLIADEPTTALDVTIQAQILELLEKLQKELGMGVMMITHDLGVIAEVADDVVVMYAGKVVEKADVREIFKNPRHPYTQGLLKSLPGFSKEKSKKRLEAIPGMVPNLLELPQGCRFQERCPFVEDQCRQSEPELRSVKTLSGEGEHEVRCVRDISHES